MVGEEVLKVPFGQHPLRDLLPANIVFAALDLGLQLTDPIPANVGKLLKELAYFLKILRRLREVDLITPASGWPPLGLRSLWRDTSDLVDPGESAVGYPLVIRNLHHRVSFRKGSLMKSAPFGTNFKLFLRTRRPAFTSLRLWGTAPGGSPRPGFGLGVISGEY